LILVTGFSFPSFANLAKQPPGLAKLGLLLCLQCLHCVARKAKEAMEEMKKIFVTKVKEKSF